MAQIIDPEILSNDILKNAFKKTHSKLVKSVNPSSAIDHLFENDVIGDDDMRDLHNISDTREKCRKLLALLHSGTHPQTFIQLRLAIKEESAYDYLVKEIDSCYRELNVPSPEPGSPAAICESNPTTAEVRTEFTKSTPSGIGNLCESTAKAADCTPINRCAPLRGLNKRLKHALCCGHHEIRSDIYPLLVLPQCGETITREVLRNKFKFLDVVPWKAVFDFDNGGGENSVYRYMDEDNGKNYAVTTVDILDWRVSDNKEEKRIVHEAVKSGTDAVWFFCNGHFTTKKEVCGLRDWRNKYMEGFNAAVRLLVQSIPQGRALVVLLSLSKDDEVMFSAVDSFCRSIDWWVAIGENNPVTSSLMNQLKTVVDEHEVGKHCIVGMPWEHVSDTFTSLFDDRVAGSCQLITSTGTQVNLPMKMKNTLVDFEIIGCNECANSDLVTNSDRREELEKFKADKEQQFYRGQQVDWWNFFFDSDVVQRDLYRKLFARVTTLLEHTGQPDDQLVSQVRLCHQPSAGGTTIAKQVLWELRAQYRCAVLKQMTDLTCDQLFELRKYKDEDNPNPVLLLLDSNISEDMANEFVAKLVDRVKKSSGGPDVKVNKFCVLLICQSKANPVESDDENDFVLRAKLSDREGIWLKDKYKQLEERFRITQLNNPQNFVSFNVMKENFDPNYMQNIVGRYTSDITSPIERQLLKYVSLISKFDRNRHPIPVSSFDSLLYKRWEVEISDPLQVLLHKTECKKGEEHTIRIISSVLSEYIYTELTGKNEKKELEADVMIEFLNTDIFSSATENISSANNAVDKLLEIIRNLMKNREKKVVNGHLSEDSFSPLIKAIYEDKRQHVPSAAKVLDRVFEITGDLFVAQQIARLYIRVHNWDEAIRYGEMITKNEDNSYLLDTLAQVYKERLNHIVREGRRSRPSPAAHAEEVLAVAFRAIDIFKKGQKVSEEEKFTLVKNNAGRFGEIKTSLLLLEYLKQVDGLQDKEVLRKFLIKQDFIPVQVRCWRRENTLRLKDLEKSVLKTIACLEDEFFQLQLKTECFSEYALLRYRKDKSLLIDHKENITRYFCDGNSAVPQDYTPQEAAEYYRRHIRRLGGDTLRGLLEIRNTKVSEEELDRKLSEILNLVKKNIGSLFETSFDLKVYLGVSLVLCTNRTAQSRQFSHEEVAQYSHKLYDKPDVLSGTDLEPFFYAAMFNWPRKFTTFAPSLRAHCLPEVLRQWKQTFVRKYPRRNEEQKKETTLFFLGNGVEMDAFAYGGELEEQNEKSHPSNEFWSSKIVKNKLERLQGVLRRKHDLSIVTLTLQQDGSDYEIDIPTALPVTEAKKLNKCVSFYVGFQWSGPKAFGIGEPLVEDERRVSTDLPRSSVSTDINLTSEHEFPRPVAPLAVSHRQSQKPKLDKKK